jgi:glycerol-3-phosphate acyltransferase PlsX
MGGDEGVRTMIAGAALARQHHDRARFLLVGDPAQISSALDRHSDLRPAVEILHAEDVISGEDKPSQALRRARNTSMGMAIHAVRDGHAGAALSAGNTGR